MQVPVITKFQHILKNRLNVLGILQKKVVTTENNALNFEKKKNNQNTGLQS